MEGLAFLFVMIAIGLLLRFLLLYDGNPNQEAHGLFAILDNPERETAATRSCPNQPKVK
jgi:hypothetical protein